MLAPEVFHYMTPLNHLCVTYYVSHTTQRTVSELRESLEEAEKQNMIINQEYRKLLAEKDVRIAHFMTCQFGIDT